VQPVEPTPLPLIAQAARVAEVTFVAFQPARERAAVVGDLAFRRDPTVSWKRVPVRMQFNRYVRACKAAKLVWAHETEDFRLHDLLIGYLEQGPESLADRNALSFGAVPFAEIYAIPHHPLDLGRIGEADEAIPTPKNVLKPNLSHLRLPEHVLYD